MIRLCRLSAGRNLDWDVTHLDMEPIQAIGAGEGSGVIEFSGSFRMMPVSILVN